MGQPVTAFPSLLAAADVATESQSDWVALVLREFSRSQATGFVLDIAKWTLLGAAAGVLLAVVVCWFFSRLGWYDLRVRFARGLRWSTYVLVILLTMLFSSAAGFWSGTLRGAERVLSQSQLATDAFPKIADVVADGMAWVQIRAEHPTGDTNAIAATLELFRNNGWELNATRFQKQLDAIHEETVSSLIIRLEETALERTPSLKGGVTEKLLHQFLTGLGRVLVEKKAADQLKGWGADRIYLAIRSQLETEAQKAGSPHTISRAELSTFIVREGIVPGIMKPIRTTARTQQLPLVALALLVIVVPPVCIRLARNRFGGKSPKSSGSQTAPPIMR